ncbi:uncharacterized protein LOC109009834 [Juglans regia]|uniref:Uncharacterized protein LOC109009834 n=1 Tax=Juglans regia TaxID=51240 RepID=A0A2I4GQ40_JUGRE|nr:uncharacterized protein LOC109009834 [Juglans regia]
MPIGRNTRRYIQQITTQPKRYKAGPRRLSLYPHDDVLVVTMLVANFTTRRILINNGNSADILFWDAFTWMGIDPSRLQPVPMLLKGFSGDMVQLVGIITLSVLIGKAPYTPSTMADFIVVKALSSYNIILGRPTLNSLKAVMSTYHLKMKFSNPMGVREVRGKQMLAQDFYVQELKLQGAGSM